MKLNHSSSIPLYAQLKDIIKAEISNGHYKHNQQLPTEVELCDIYGVSRITARRAISDLVEEGYLTRQQGKGTFVKEKILKRELISVNGFSEHIIQSGEKPNSQILSCDVVEATSQLTDLLHVNGDSPLLQLKRILYIDDEPFVLEIAHYPLERFHNLQEYITQSTSTYEILSKKYNVTFSSNTKTINVILADSDQSKYLKCDLGQPLYFIEKIAYDINHVPVHTSSLFLRADRAKFTVNSTNK
ncbi:GntR family transcriptional regulator [Halalkalibacter alkalisediminis]|uniref:GntR family transcriptional regulator n=1 Tax=Halalkalibacter alkalisediminis TaxID=935616 RepID=A0ABV6NEF4_9BACI|nr:GntR family transcriptional regulator [Halalkalibacter alkalisediminis]